MDPPRRTIGVSAPNMEASAVRAMVQGIVYVSEQRGAHVLVTDARLDGDRQREQIDRLVDEHVDALLVYPTAPPTALRPALDRAVAAGIPLFAHDDVGHPAVITEFVTPGGEMATLAADLVAGLVDGGSEVGVVGGVPAPQILERTEAFVRRLAERYPALRLVAEVVNETDDAAGARPVVAELLRAHPRLAALFTYNDASALGAADAAAEADRRDLVIVGNNGEPLCVRAIREGRIAGTVERYPIELGQKAATLILDILGGELALADAPQRIASKPEVVTAENAARFPPWEERMPQPDWARSCTVL